MGVAPSLQVLRRDLHRHRHGQGRRLLRQGDQLDFQQGLYVGEDLDVFQQFDGKAGRLAPDVAQGKGLLRARRLPRRRGRGWYGYGSGLSALVGCAQGQQNMLAQSF